MAILIDRVYRTVQAILNKEQRGQLPPGDFNNISSLSQLELFDDLIYDKGHFNVSRKSNTNIKESLAEKIALFQRRALVTQTGAASNVFDLPADLYRLDTVEHIFETKRYITERIDTDMLQDVVNSDKACPTNVTPKYIRLGDTIEMYPSTIVIPANVSVFYIKEPNTPSWNSISLGSASVPLYNSASSVDFELHRSMEDDLIRTILFYAGVSIRNEEVSSAVAQVDQKNESTEKN